MEEPSDLALYIRYDSGSTTNGPRELAVKSDPGPRVSGKAMPLDGPPPPTAVTTRKLIFFEHH